MNRLPAGSAVQVPGNCTGTDCRGTGLFTILFPYLEQDNRYGEYSPFINAKGGWSDYYFSIQSSLNQIVVPGYTCPSVSEWTGIPYRKDYHGCMGGKTHLWRNIPRHVYIDGVFYTNSFLPVSQILRRAKQHDSRRR